MIDSAYFGAMALATLVGLSLGTLGSGGSIIVTPVLVYVAHIPPEKAVGMSLLIVGLTSLVGAILNFRRGNIAVRPVVFLATSGVVGSFLGSTATHLVTRRTLMLLFAGLMIVVGLAMWKGSAGFRKCQTFRASHCLSAGFLVGLLTGFLGIGGGFLIVPTLVLFGGLDTKLAAGSSLAVITVNAMIGLVGQLRFQPLEWTSVTGFLLFAIAGMVIGNRVSQHLPEFHVRRIFAVTVVIVGASIGLENLL